MSCKCLGNGLLLCWCKQFALLFHSTVISKIKEDKKNNQQGLLNPTGQFRAASIRSKDRLIQRQNQKKIRKTFRKFQELTLIISVTQSFSVYGLKESSRKTDILRTLKSCAFWEISSALLSPVWHS